MKKLVNNEYIEMTSEEIAEFEKTGEEASAQPVAPTDKDRISALESAITDLAMMIMGVSSND